MRQGRPLRFLALTLSGWAMARVVMLWPEVALPDAAMASPIVASYPVEHASAEPRDANIPLASPNGLAPVRLSSKASMSLSGVTAGPVTGRHGMADRMPPLTTGGNVAVFAALGAPVASMAVATTTAEALPTNQASAAMPAPHVMAAAALPRLAGSTWFVARPGGGENLAFGQLGASQAGVRLTYALGEDRRVALSGRLSTPVRGRGREGAMGLDWQPTRLPVHLLVEGRVPLDGGRARPAAQLIAGVAKPLPFRGQFEAYAQAGAVHRRGGFADGSARIVRPVLDTGAARVDFGAGIWGAAQRGASRIDLGPTLSIAVPVGGAAIRLGVDYRLRVTGKARPGSGPALTLGSSF